MKEQEEMVKISEEKRMAQELKEQLEAEKAAKLKQEEEMMHKIQMAELEKQKIEQEYQAKMEQDALRRAEEIA